MTTHFRPHLSAAAVVFAILYLLCRSHAAAALAMALLAPLAWPVAPYLGAAPPPPGPGIELRVVIVNLQGERADMTAVIDLLRRERPDVVLLTELLPAHRKLLQGLGDFLPHRAESGTSGIFEVLLLSGLPIRSVKLHYPVVRHMPVIEARLCGAPARCLTVVGMHAPPPIADWSAWRDQVLRFAAGIALNVRDGRVVLLGDLNAAPWSPIFVELLRIGGLTDAALGSPFRSTWLSPVPLFGLPLDHVLIGPGIRPVSRRLGDGFGSDHFPVIADLVVPASGR